MNRIQNLRRQHDLIEETAADILPASRNIPDIAAAEAILARLGRLDAILTEHLAAEDGFYYPELSRSADPEVAAMATRFFDEMGGLVDQFVAFKMHWSQAERLYNHPIGFRSEFKAIFAALSVRIHRENEELYPLAQRAGSAEHSGKAAA